MTKLDHSGLFDNLVIPRLVQRKMKLVLFHNVDNIFWEVFENSFIGLLRRVSYV